MTEIFKRMVEEKLTPNSYYVLHCIKESEVPHTFVNKHLEVKKLQNEGWLHENLQLTSKSLIFIEEINGFFKKSKKKTSKDLMGEKFLKNIQDYVELFPNRKLSSGKLARTNPKNLEVVFRWFFETYDYDWDLILKATKKMINEYELKNFEFMRTSHYFVRKQNPIDKSFESDLADYCEFLKTNPDDNQIYFKERVD
jgi:hypothetical protein